MKKRRRGRRKTDLVFKCRTQAWLYAVSAASGWLTPAELELLFCNSGDGNARSPKNRPGLWAKYESGKVCPTIYSKPGKPSIVDRVEQRFPGTAQWIRLPLWELLTSKHMSMDDLKKIYLSLEPDVRDIIVTDPSDQYPQFWHTDEFIDDICKQLLEIGNVDAFTAILCLLREAKLKQSVSEFGWVLEYWRKSEQLMRAHPVLKRYREFMELTIDTLIEGDEDYW